MSYRVTFKCLIDCGNWIFHFSLFIFLDVRLFEAVALLLVDILEHEAEQQGGYAEACQHDERGGVVVRHGGLLRGDEAGLKVAYELRVGLVEHLADEHGEEPQADVLYPENQGVGAADDFGVDKLGHAGPKRCGHEREAGAENEDCDVGHDNSAYGVALEHGQDEGEGEVAGDEQQRAYD